MSPAAAAPFLRSVRLSEGPRPDEFPFDLPAVRHLRHGLDFGPVTVFVGDNGTGKSTLVEALAVACGFNAEGGSKNLRFETLSTHSDLHDHLALTWSSQPRWGWFLRAETYYGMATHITLDDGPHGIRELFPDLHSRSHGQSFLALADSRFRSPGLYLFDEPESALSFHGQLQLLRLVHEAVDVGAQFIIATHSPLLAAHPTARIYQFDDDCITEVTYDESELVQLWRLFMDSPTSFLRPLLDG